MTRKNAREISIQLIFAESSYPVGMEALLEQFFDAEHYESLKAEDPLFKDYPDNAQMDYIKRLLTSLDEKKQEIDGYIEQYAKGWKLERISKTALAILRCAVCEIMYMDDIPNSAAINEAVELDKGYDEADTVSFVNGVLGGIVRGELNVDTQNRDDADEIAAASNEELSENFYAEVSEVAEQAPEFAGDDNDSDGNSDGEAN